MPFTVGVLLLGAAAHAVAGELARAAGGDRRPWLVTASLLAVLLLDELAAVHEQLEILGHQLGGGDGFLHFAWLLPGALIGLGFVLAAVHVCRPLPRPSAALFLTGAALCVGAAVGLGALGGDVLDGVGDGPLYIIVSHVEGLLETVAASFMLLAALRAVRVQ